VEVHLPAKKMKANLTCALPCRAGAAASRRHAGLSVAEGRPAVAPEPYDAQDRGAPCAVCCTAASVLDSVQSTGATAQMLRKLAAAAGTAWLYADDLDLKTCCAPSNHECTSARQWG